MSARRYFPLPLFPVYITPMTATQNLTAAQTKALRWIAAPAGTKHTVGNSPRADVVARLFALDLIDANLRDANLTDAGRIILELPVETVEEPAAETAEIAEYRIVEVEVRGEVAYRIVDSHGNRYGTHAERRDADLTTEALNEEHAPAEPVVQYADLGGHTLARLARRGDTAAKAEQRWRANRVQGMSEPRPVTSMPAEVTATARDLAEEAFVDDDPREQPRPVEWSEVATPVLDRPAALPRALRYR